MQQLYKSPKLSAGNQGHININETKIGHISLVIGIKLNFNKTFVIRTHLKSLSNNTEFNLSHKKDKIRLCKISRYTGKISTHVKHMFRTTHVQHVLNIC